MQVTPEQCGASQLACNIINNTFLVLDGFAPLRKQLDASENNGTLTFASELARVTDREIKAQRDEDHKRMIQELGKLSGLKEDSVEMKILTMSDAELSS